ncbi:hypothetical protein FGO68_gene15363 [Halteria grandinella]|uniref:Uncharacterized protein n=1 Tax=Halteria grandinella TaxID=5974 RepID=A0A8J8T8Q7_HALGN|nr:hypothetical protein FGO68_gene15363 [Halteria grandinella]
MFSLSRVLKVYFVHKSLTACFSGKRIGTYTRFVIMSSNLLTTTKSQKSRTSILHTISKKQISRQPTLTGITQTSNIIQSLIFFSAMIIQNFSVHIEKFSEDNRGEIYKHYTMGLMFEASVIDEKIQAIKDKFIRTFLVRFLPPFLGVVMITLICEAMFIVIFT